MTHEEARDALNPEPKGGPSLWINPDAVDTPEVKPGDRVTFDALGWKAIGTVTRCDENGVTIREERPAPPRPTLADMTPDERDECRGMQADLAQGDRVVILDGHPGLAGRVRVLEASLDTFRPTPKEVTPRPDLPRMEWPANRTTQAAADQADRTTQAVAEGAVWGDAEELRRACAASNFDHITVTDKNGDVAQWFGKIAYWTPVGPRQPSAPFTVTHTSRRDEK